MTRDEAIAELRNIAAECSDDSEMAHSLADRVLLDFLRASGCSDLSDAYEAVRDACDGFWYA